MLLSFHVGIFRREQYTASGQPATNSALCRHNSYEFYPNDAPSAAARLLPRRRVKLLRARRADIARVVTGPGQRGGKHDKYQCNSGNNDDGLSRHGSSPFAMVKGLKTASARCFDVNQCGSAVIEPLWPARVAKCR